MLTPLDMVHAMEGGNRDQGIVSTQMINNLNNFYITGNFVWQVHVLCKSLIVQKYEMTSKIQRFKIFSTTINFAPNLWRNTVLYHCHWSRTNTQSRLAAGVSVYVSAINTGHQINAGCGSVA